MVQTRFTSDRKTVVGASLAGLMTGIALSRAGLKVTILERVGAKPGSGAVLQVNKNSEILEKTCFWWNEVV